jgi:O-antigen ligase
MIASVIAGGSRAGSVLVVLEVLFVISLAAIRRMVSVRSVGLALLGATGVFTVVMGWDVLWQRFKDQDPFAGRREMNLSSLAMIRDQPLTGFGLGNWSTAYPGYAVYDDGTRVNQAHNDWAQWGVEGGTPVLLAMGLVALLLIPPAIRSLWGIGLISVLVHCSVDYPMQQRPALAACFFLLAGVVWTYSAHRSAHEIEAKTDEAQE